MLGSNHRFPILKVPILPFEKIIRHLDLVEIIDLSSLSSKLCLSITSCCLKTRDFHDIELEFDYNPHKLHEFQGDLVVYQVPFFQVSTSTAKKSITLTRHGCEIHIDPTNIHVEIVNVQGNETKLQDFLKPDYITLKIFSLPEFFRPAIRHVDTVVVPDNTVPIPTDIIDMITTKLSMRKLSISRKINSAYSFSGPLLMEQVFLLDADWLSANALLDMNCKVISIENETLSVEILNKIISHWKMGGLQNLGRFSMYMDVERKSGELKKKQVIRGLEVIRWNEKRRPRCFGTKDCSKAVDILRSDGVIATILFDYGVIDVLSDKKD